MSTIIDATDMNKIARTVLKKSFPGVTFSVRKSAGGSMNVSWTNGPTEDAVSDLLEFAKGADFDGYITDSRIARAATGALYAENMVVAEAIAEFVGGWDVQFRPANDFVSTSRNYTRETIDTAIAEVEAEYGVTVERTACGQPSLQYSADAELRAPGMAQSWGEVVYGTLEATDFTTEA